MQIFCKSNNSFLKKKYTQQIDVLNESTINNNWLILIDLGWIAERKSKGET